MFVLAFLLVDFLYCFVGGVGGIWKEGATAALLICAPKFENERPWLNHHHHRTTTKNDWRLYYVGQVKYHEADHYFLKNLILFRLLAKHNLLKGECPVPPVLACSITV
jgi:hypothetical protein